MAESVGLAAGGEFRKRLGHPQEAKVVYLVVDGVLEHVRSFQW
jgi:hypothetical protein